MTFTFGADPEFALSLDGQFKSAISILPEKKKSVKANGNSFYYDNVLAEVGLKPASSKEEVLENVRNAIKELHCLSYPAVPTIQAAMKYKATELKHERASEAGCFPELSAYTLNRVVPPTKYIEKDKKTDYMYHTTPLRTVGGHIHLGSDDGPLQDGMMVPYVVKMLDLFLAIPELFFNKDATTKLRRKVYGLAGTHRTPEYGLEYRTPSNYWLSSPIFVGIVYDLCEFSIRFVAEGLHKRFWTIDESRLDEDDPSVAHHCFGYNPKWLEHTINNCDKAAGNTFMALATSYMTGNLGKDVYSVINYVPKSLADEWAV